MTRRLSVAAILALFFTVGSAQAQPIGVNHRLVKLFIQDGALVRQGWVEARGSYSDWDGGEDLFLGALLALRLGNRWEVGGNFGYLDRSRDAGDVLFGGELSSDFDNNGLSDLDVYGKFQLTQENRETTLGLLIKIPSGDDREFLGSGRTDYELFFASRQTYEKTAWVWTLALRDNGDSRTPAGGEGDVSVRAGGGAIVKMSYSWAFIGEAFFESKRYEESDAQAMVVPSFEFRPTENVALRLSFGLGLADGSPDTEVILGGVFHF